MSAAGFSLEDGKVHLRELQRAAQTMVLASELHACYLVSPLTSHTVAATVPVMCRAFVLLGPGARSRRFR